MKMMYCQSCGSIVVPNRKDMVVSWCHCHRHAVWWRDGAKGLISVHDEECSIPNFVGNDPADAAQQALLYSPPMRPRAFLIGLTNAFLQFPGDDISAEQYQEIIDGHSDYYMFKTRRTCVVRFRPGHSSDSRWERKLPQ